MGGSSRRRLAVLGAVGLLLSVMVVRGNAQGELDPVLGNPGITYPDLQPDTQNFFVSGFGADTPKLRFDTLSKNLGEVALQITAEVSDDPMNPNVRQCVSWYADRVCREDRPVGGFSWHEAHTHFHFNDFATYSLRRLLPDGTPDYSSAGLISTSEKVSFCLIDIQRFDDDAFPAPYYTYGNCLAPAIMGISPGWADNYDRSLDGQELSMVGLTDGRYALIIDQDPENRLFETDETNNRVVAIFQVTGLGTMFPQASIISREWPASGGGGGSSTTSTSTTTTSTSTTTTSTSTTTTSAPTTTTTAPCRGGGGGGGGGGKNGGGGGGGGKCR